jgi:hypothetical protein
VDVTPTKGVEAWANTPSSVTCFRCFPAAGFGYRTDPGWKPINGIINPTNKNVKSEIRGKCRDCAGTGVEPCPITEITSHHWAEFIRNK